MAINTLARDNETPGIAASLPAYLAGVQGLRTVAALMVAVYHIWFGRVSGGVDVFFVVAGYFAAKSLLKLRHSEGARDRMRLVVAYWLRTLCRITPSAVVVIIGTVAAALLFMPQSAWQYAIPHGFASLFHYENWQLIASGADYLQEGMSATPFQQFWALSLQAQFSLLFPLLLVAVMGLAARRGWSAGRVAFVALGAALVLSFAFSLWYTAQNQPAAYFNTFARGWEFLAGAILYLLMTRGLRNRTLAATLGWIGLIALVSLGAVLDVSQAFPGLPALIPVAAAILIMISSASGSEPVVLRAGPMVWFANSSFAFYLWHWPVLVMYRYRFGEQVGLKGGLVILLISAILAYLTTRFVETPIRNWKRIQRSVIGTLTVIALLIAPAFGALAFWQHSFAQQQARAAAAMRAALAGEDLPDGELVPTPAQARDDIPVFYSKRCHQLYDRPEVKSCVLGDPDGEVTIAVAGGSHSGQWMDLITEIAEQVHARVVPYIKMRCQFADMTRMPEVRDPSCVPWADEVYRRLLDSPPDLLITLGTLQRGDSDGIPEGFAEYFEGLAEQGIPILGIRDNPRFDFDVPECVERYGAERAVSAAKSRGACERPRDAFYDGEPGFDFSDFGDFTFVDIADDACPGDTCRVVQGNVLMYRDMHHLTRTWTLRHGDRVRQAIRDRFDGASRIPAV